MRASFMAFVGLAGLVAAGSVQAQSATPWVHVRVEEPGRSSKVRVNLPLTVVQAALNAAPERIASHGRIHLGKAGGHDLSVSDLRKIWHELKATGDTEFVSVEQEDETVKVARVGSRVQVRVQKPSEKQQVLVDVPVSLVDALLSGEGDEVDLRAAFKELNALRGEIVKVDEKDTSIRVWIDERP